MSRRFKGFYGQCVHLARRDVLKNVLFWLNSLFKVIFAQARSEVSLIGVYCQLGHWVHSRRARGPSRFFVVVVWFRRFANARVLGIDFFVFWVRVKNGVAYAFPVFEFVIQESERRFAVLPHTVFAFTFGMAPEVTTTFSARVAL